MLKQCETIVRWLLQQLPEITLLQKALGYDCCIFILLVAMLTSTPVMWGEEHTWNFSILQTFPVYSRPRNWEHVVLLKPTRAWFLQHCYRPRCQRIWADGDHTAIQISRVRLAGQEVCKMLLLNLRDIGVCCESQFRPRPIGLLQNTLQSAKLRCYASVLITAKQCFVCSPLPVVNRALLGNDIEFLLLCFFYNKYILSYKIPWFVPGPGRSYRYYTGENPSFILLSLVHF
jgi:hypothetical protein